jgi:transglutaminase-like putative cysteine protease
MTIQAEVTQHRNLRYVFSVTNPTSKLIEAEELIVFAPEDRVHKFKITNLPPLGRKIFSIKERVEIHDIPVRVFPEDNSVYPYNYMQYVSPQKYIESDSKTISEIAKKLSGKTDEETIDNTSEFVRDYLNKKPYTGKIMGALWAVKHKKGDCTEHACLATALLRANDIHSRVVSGFIVKKDQVLTPAASHDWAEVFLNGCWRVVDCHRNNKMENEKDYIVFRTLQQESPAPDGSLLNKPELTGLNKYKISNNDLTVTMKGLSK